MRKIAKEEGEELALVASLLEDQIYLIDTRLKELDPSPDGRKSAVAALRQLREVSELAKALLSTVRKGREPDDD
jgi:hypothetical protein